MAKGVGITPKETIDFVSKQISGRRNLGFIPQDYNNYVRSKCTREINTGSILEYLQKKQFEGPNFFYAIQVDEDYLITNIF